MKLDRAPFLQAVTLCKPAIADKSIIQELTFLFSDGATLTAYDDVIGIQVPFASGLVGGVKGTLLLGMLENATAKQIEIEQDNPDEVLLKSGRFRVTLALLPADRAVYQLPKGKAKPFRLSLSFYEALKACLPALSSKAVLPDQLGISIALHDSLRFFATDSNTMAFATMKHNCDQWPFKQGLRVILPAAFAKQLIDIGTDGTTLYLTANEALAETDKGIKLFSRLIFSPKPHDFQRTLEAEMKSVQLFTIPPRLETMLDRALLIFEHHPEKLIAAQLQIKDGTLRVAAKTKHEALNDSTKLDEIPQDKTALVVPKRLKRVLPLAERMGLTENGVVLTGKNVIYLVANHSEA
jgi:hypothetical protein